MNAPAPSLKSGAWPYRLLATAVVAWSFGWTYVCGCRGLFILDQTQIFDAAWRIVCGQVPYKDFLQAQGPLAAEFQAVFFRLFGVTWSAYVLAPATLAAGAALATMRLTRLLYGEQRRGLILSSGLLVGTLFQSMYGTLIYEQVGFFCMLLGVVALVQSVGRAGVRRHAWQAAAGVCAVLAFLGKQNVGALALALLGLLVLVAEWPKPRDLLKGVCAYAAGLAVSAVLFGLWLLRYSSVRGFIHGALYVPAKGRRGLFLHVRNLMLPDFLANVGIVKLSLPSAVTPWCYAFALGAASLAVFRGVYDPDFRRRLQEDARLRLAVALAAAVPFVQAAFQLGTAQEVRNVLFFSGWALALGVGLAVELSPAKSVRRWLAAMAALTGAFLFVDGLHASWYRQEHLVFSQHPKVVRALRIPPLASLRWLDPTYVWITAPTEIGPQEVEDTYNYLVAHPQRFFVFGDSTFFYGITGTVPPVRLLYFQPGAYYTSADVPALDRDMLASLQKNDVRLVVRETVTFFNRPDRPEKPTEAFPLTQAWIDQNFTAGPTFGNYQILLHK